MLENSQDLLALRSQNKSPQKGSGSSSRSPADSASHGNTLPKKAVESIAMEAMFLLPMFNSSSANVKVAVIVAAVSNTIAPPPLFISDGGRTPA